ncbi:hypothetical protein SAMN04490244_10254 [Tranquillimonas rosea]|uniref:Uncharacterized protein n=1 Tax=Tranquillimonas rosea TaxID=641238 RepID=A0A1H9QZT1_9RHOB|nr:hypothetical protein [Tranquillimonas rosea]SER65755.1 hypothetical protein SAMN04490244_10254 [Tranquillimonas rosea]
MTRITILTRGALAAAAIAATGVAQAATCEVRMPDPRGNAEVAGQNAALRDVLAAEYGIRAPVPTGGNIVTIDVPECEASDFVGLAATDQRVSTPASSPVLPEGAGAVGQGAIAGGLIGAAVLFGVLSDDGGGSTPATVPLAQ